MVRQKFNLLIASAAVLAAVASAPAAAQSTWTYANFTENGTNAGNYGNSFSNTISGTKLTVSAFSSTGGSNTFQTANIANYGAGSGFGVRNQVEGLGVTSPQHAMDNYAHTDLLMLNFTNASNSAPVSLVLSELATGWHNTSTASCPGGGTNCVDSDISLLRWTGGSAPTVTGGTVASLLSSGWQLVNHYDDMVDDVSRKTGAGSGSSWWLISAYNSGWGTGTNTSGANTSNTNLANLSGGNDFVKVLSSITAVQSGGLTPEPGSLTLAAAALCGVLGLSRRRRQG